MQTSHIAPDTDDALRGLLDQHYGDGQIYFEDESDRDLFTLAASLGYTSEDGCLTVEGKRISLTLR